MPGVLPHRGRRRNLEVRRRRKDGSTQGAQRRQQQRGRLATQNTSSVQSARRARGLGAQEDSHLGCQTTYVGFTVSERCGGCIVLGLQDIRRIGLRQGVEKATQNFNQEYPVLMEEIIVELQAMLEREEHFQRLPGAPPSSEMEKKLQSILDEIAPKRKE